MSSFNFGSHHSLFCQCSIYIAALFMHYWTSATKWLVQTSTHILITSQKVYNLMTQQQQSYISNSTAWLVLLMNEVVVSDELCTNFVLCVLFVGHYILVYMLHLYLHTIVSHILMAFLTSTWLYILYMSIQPIS